MNAAPATTVPAAPAARPPCRPPAPPAPPRRTGRRRLARSPAPPGAAAPAPARRCPAAGISPPAPSPAAAAAAPPAGTGPSRCRRPPRPDRWPRSCRSRCTRSTRWSPSQHGGRRTSRTAAGRHRPRPRSWRAGRASTSPAPAGSRRPSGPAPTRPAPPAARQRPAGPGAIRPPARVSSRRSFHPRSCATSGIIARARQEDRSGAGGSRLTPTLASGSDTHEWDIGMHERRIEIRWSDLDAYAHVYHPVYLTYMEAARDQWLGRVLELRGRIWDYVVARVTIDYRGALALADGAAVVRCRLQRIGRSSLTTREQVLAPDGRVAAEAEVVIVAWDATTGGSRPLEQVERAALERELEHVGA